MADGELLLDRYHLVFLFFLLFFCPFLNELYDTCCFRILIDCVERKFDKILKFVVS